MVWRCVMLMAFLPSFAAAAEAYAAVAANFAEPARELAAAYARTSGNAVRISSGSTGALYAQISHGAPFDLFLAADEKTPVRLVKEGLAAADSRFTYAVGSLVVWSADPNRIRSGCEALLKGGGYRRVAIANPAVAPYGAAARAVLRAWGLWDALAPKLLRAESVGQAFQFIATGNAELGFVAGSQVLSLEKGEAGSSCAVDPEFYPPLRQQAVLLMHGEGNAAAAGFLKYLRGDDARAIIGRFGYLEPGQRGK
jgi:molybdate transport system substrate-binding protein